MMNQRELDLTVASLDVLISKHIGVAGMAVTACDAKDTSKAQRTFALSAGFEF
jgi:hypothetical protein